MADLGCVDLDLASSLDSWVIHCPDLMLDDPTHPGPRPAESPCTVVPSLRRYPCSHCRPCDRRRALQRMRERGGKGRDPYSVRYEQQAAATIARLQRFAEEATTNGESTRGRGEGGRGGEPEEQEAVAERRLTTTPRTRTHMRRDRERESGGGCPRKAGQTVGGRLASATEGARTLT